VQHLSFPLVPALAVVNLQHLRAGSNDSEGPEISQHLIEYWATFYSCNTALDLTPAVVKYKNLKKCFYSFISY
jgi:hypothetical protein